MKNSSVKKIVYLVCTLLIAGVIFFFSSQPASKSSQLSTPVAMWVAKILSYLGFGADESFSHFHNIIRNIAHMIMFTCLGFCGGRYISHYKPNPKFLLILFLCCAYGFLDEIKQAFIPGRGFSPIDVGMDSVGTLIGIMASVIVYILIEKKERKGGNEKDNNDR